jgi:Sulfotransferase family
MRVRSKYSQEYFERLPDWLAKRMLAAWYGLPNRFVSPYRSRTRFVFVCGCGHSGTTLTAAKLGNHSQVFLIGRETNAFFPERGVQSGKRLVAEWDYFAQAAGKSTVVEKTPKHVQCVRTIRRIVPAARVILTVRNPLDNIASLYRRFGDLEASLGRWIVDNRAVAQLSGSDDTLLVRFEDLTGNPSGEFRRILEFVELPWEANILAPGDTNYGKFDQDENMSLRAEQVRREIMPRNGVWNEVLSAEQAKWVEARTASLAESLGYP